MDEADCDRKNFADRVGCYVPRSNTKSNWLGDFSQLEMEKYFDSIIILNSSMWTYCWRAFIWVLHRLISSIQWKASTVYCMYYIRHNIQCQLMFCHWLFQMFINLLQLVQMSINSIHLEGACNHLEEYVTAVTG